MKFFDSFPNGVLPSVQDYRRAAQRRLPASLFAFLEAGSFYEETSQANCSDLQKMRVRRRVLTDVSKIDMQTTVLGQTLPFPLILAPVGFAGVFAHRGEEKAARAAASVGIPFSLSAASILSIAERARAVSTPFWCQISLYKDRSYTQAFLDQAREAKCPVLLLTADLPMIGSRYRYLRTLIQSPLRRFWDTLTHLPWWLDVYCRKTPLTLGNMPPTSLTTIAQMRRWMGNQIDPSANWKDFEWLRERWPGKIAIKGIMDPADALLAKKMGADAIIVSNHGGRHLDRTPSTLSALVPIVQALAGDIEILFDGGLTTGLDLIKPLALGARACLIGRAWVYALASYGESGVCHILNLFQSELKLVMAHLGITRISALTPSIFV